MTPGDRLQRARKQRGLTRAELATATGVAERTVKAHETGQRSILREVAEQYGRILEVQPEFILFGPRSRIDGAPEARMIPLLGEVAGGVWREIPYEEPEPLGYIAFSDPTYDRAERVFALTVVGPSMNRYYPDGTTVAVVDAIEAGVRAGDHVVVRRRRANTIETTIKEVVMGKNKRVELWPRSTDENFQEPILLERVRDADEGPEITGVVVGIYQKKERGRGPLVL